MVPNMKIGLVVAKTQDNQTQKNMRTIIKLIDKYQDHDLILFSEAFLQGFNSLSWDYEIDKNIAVSVDSPEITQIREAAQNKNSAGFGFLESYENKIYCSYIIIGKDSQTIDLYRRVSIGWKEYSKTDSHYCEGTKFHSFTFNGKKMATALCGDLWDDFNIKRINNLKASLILWPVHLDYSKEQWELERRDYLDQMAKINCPIALVNDISEFSRGGAIFFNNTQESFIPLDKEGILTFEI